MDLNMTCLSSFVISSGASTETAILSMLESYCLTCLGPASIFRIIVQDEGDIQLFGQPIGTHVCVNCTAAWV